MITRVRILREALGDILRNRPSLRMVGAAASVDENAAEQFGTALDIVLLNLADANWFHFAETALRTFPGTRLVAIGGDQRGDQLDAAAGAGICGYLSPDDSSNDLVATIEGLARGDVPCTPGIAAALVRRVTREAGRGAQLQMGLTRRELEVVGCLREDLSNKEIAQRLGIEVATVKNHVHNVLLKLGVHRRGDSAVLNFEKT